MGFWLLINTYVYNTYFNIGCWGKKKTQNKNSFKLIKLWKNPKFKSLSTEFNNLFASLVYLYIKTRFIQTHDY